MEIYNQTEDSYKGKWYGDIEPEDSYTGKWYGDIEPNRGQL